MPHLSDKAIRKKAILGATLYTFIIGVGMYVSFHIYDIRYGNPEMLSVLWKFEIALILLGIFWVFRYFSWQEVGFCKWDRKQAIWFLPTTLIVAAMWVGQLNFLISNSLFRLDLFLYIGGITFLVGFSEELMFRGVVFSAFLRRLGGKESKLPAVLTSAVAFSLIHSVNILAGYPAKMVGTQLIFTFIFGLYLALIRLRIKSIIPLILFHWLWDFFIFQGSKFHYSEKIPFSVIHQVVIVGISIILFYLLIKKERKEKTSKTSPLSN